MSYITLALLFILSGFFMKYSDDLFDENNNVVYACIFGVFCGLSSALASIYDVQAAYIFFGILIGNFLALKIDGIHHILTLVVFLAIVLICGIPNMSLVILLICVLSALLDEVGHDLIGKFTQNKFLNLFFEYRFVMKVVMLLLVVCGVFNIWIFVCFLLFEISYTAAEFLFESFY